MAKEKWEMSALDAYINKVFKFDVLFVPILCVCAGITITVLYLMDLYDVINSPMLIVFDISVFIYLAIGIYFTRTGFGENGIVLPEKLRKL